MRQVPYCGPTNIRGQSTQFICPWFVHTWFTSRWRRDGCLL